jgi:hypothetical protein
MTAGRNKMRNPVHTDTAKYDFLTRFIFVALPLGLLITAVVLALQGQGEGATVMAGDALLVFLIFYAIAPRRYEIYADRVRIVLGGPFAVNIPMATIKEAKRTSSASAFSYSGVRFATSFRYVVEIVRSKGMNYVISPSNGDMFLQWLHQEMQLAGNSPQATPERSRKTR